MDTKQADAIAKAILEPDLEAREQLRLKRASGAALEMRKRRVAWFCLIGGAIGAAVAVQLDRGFGLGIIVGAMIGSVIGWAAMGRRS